MLCLTVEIESDDSLPAGWLFARVVELDVGTQLRIDEDPLPVLDKLVEGHFQGNRSAPQLSRSRESAIRVA
jgi:hypothetical protein